MYLNCYVQIECNVTKTEFIIFKPPKKQLSQIIVLKLNWIKIFESLKNKTYLGVILDPFLRWNNHINHLTKKLNRAIGMIYKIRYHCTKIVLRSLYFSLFHSHLSYGLSVWGTSNAGYLSKLARQRKSFTCNNLFGLFRTYVTTI